MKSNSIIFVAVGAVAGFIGGYFLGKIKEQKIANEEIKSVIEEFSRQKDKSEHSKTESAEEETEEESEDDEEENLVSQYEYVRSPYYHNFYEKEVGKTMSKEANIELITEDDFGNYEDDRGIPYDTEHLYYYADGVLADFENDVIGKDEIDSTVGLQSLKHFKELDVVHVRNHDLGLDYEILKSLLKFEEVKKREATYEYD